MPQRGIEGIVEQLEVPVAYCMGCEETGPVIVQDFDNDHGLTVNVVYCPQCESIINFDKEVKVEWYPIEDIEKVTGWKALNEQ